LKRSNHRDSSFLATIILMTMAKPVSKTSESTFESALERLEQIVGEMEGDKLVLEDLLARYEEGTRLVKVCQQRLDSAERRIELIARGAGGEAEVSEFDPTAVAATAARPTPAATPRRSTAPSSPEDVSLF
jgi:exodeoxyribonuclease VII small subunit